MKNSGGQAWWSWMGLTIILVVVIGMAQKQLLHRQQSHSQSPPMPANLDHLPLASQSGRANSEPFPYIARVARPAVVAVITPAQTNAEVDPAAATNSIEDDHEMAMRLKAMDFAEKDPNSALRWALSLTDPVEQTNALETISCKIAEHDPAAAVALVDKLQLGQQDSALLPGLVAQWGGNDLNAALAWAQSYPVGESRADMIARLAFVQSASAPIDAANLVVEQIPPGSVQDDAVISVLGRWALSDFKGAASWVDRFPEGLLKERAAQELETTAAGPLPQMVTSQPGIAIP